MLATLLLTRLRSHIGRSLVLVVVIAIAAGIALGALAVFRTTDDPWAPLVAATNGGDVEIDEAPARPDPAALAAIPGVATVGTLIESGDAALQVGPEAMVVSLRRMPDRETMVVDRPLMLAGRWFQSADEVVFEATFADSLGIEVGDQVVLGGERNRTVLVVGAAATTMMPNFPERVPGSVFAGDTLYDAIGPVGDPRWSVGLRLRDPSRAEGVVDRLSRTGPVPAGVCPGEPGWCARSADDIRANAFPLRANGFAQIMLFFAVLMLVAAVMLIVTLLGSRLVSESRELTLLQVAGVTPGRLAMLIALEHAVLAVVGAAAGTGIALLVAPRITDSAATVFGSISPNLSLTDVAGVAAVAVVVSVVVSGLGGLRAGRRSLAVVARGGSGRVRRSRVAALAMASSAGAALVLGLKDIATRRGRTVSIVLSVGLAVTIAVAIVGLGTASFQEVPETQVAAFPSDPADISDLPPWPSAVSDEVVGRVMNLITILQVLLGGVAVVTLLAAASMSVQERLRELGVLHALGCSGAQLAGASGISHGALGAIGTLVGVPLGLGFYLVFRAATGGGLTGLPPLWTVLLVALGAVGVAVAAGVVPALFVQRRATSEALAAE